MKTVQARKFRYGAYIIIASRVGCSSEYVRSVVNGRRSNKSDKARLILEIAEQLLTKTEPVNTEIKKEEIIINQELQTASG